MDHQFINLKKVSTVFFTANKTILFLHMTDFFLVQQEEGGQA